MVSALAYIVSMNAADRCIALLERKGERVALLITKGYRDILHIGNQARPNLFDLSIRRLEKLYEKVVEVDERITIESFTEDPYPKPIDVKSDPALREGLTGEAVRVLREPDYTAVERDLKQLWDQGFRNISVALMHSYTYPDHEVGIERIARKMGFRIAVSSQLQSMAKLVPRAQSAVTDAYLSPITQRYLDHFQKGFKGGLSGENAHKLLISQSDGGLVNYASFTGLRGILSGPAGGVVGVAKTCYDPLDGTPVLGFDSKLVLIFIYMIVGLIIIHIVGGTSTDVVRYSGILEHVFESTISEITIQTPQLNIRTVAAGGGSMLFWEKGLFRVGPNSAGANPGPACYGNGGPLTVTDANCLLGRIVPDYFPRKIDFEAVKSKFEAMRDTINMEKEGDSLSIEEVASGFLAIANAQMSRPIRTISEGRGYSAGSHNLCCFGGAGGQHAIAVARQLGIKRAIVPRYSSILSAYGMALADVVTESGEPASLAFSESAIPELERRFGRLCERGTDSLKSQGFSEAQVQHELFLNMRYRGSDTTFMIPKPASLANFGSAFVERHEQEFGFSQTARDILVDDFRVRSVGKTTDIEVTTPFAELKKLAASTSKPAVAKAKLYRQVYFDDQGWAQTGIYELPTLEVGAEIVGPAIILDSNQTIIVEPRSKAIILPEHVILDIYSVGKAEISTEVVDPVQLSVFSHRFV